MDTDENRPPVRCVATQGFKYHNADLRRSIMAIIGQEITLPVEEYDRLRALSAVATIEETRQEEANQEALREKILRAHFGDKLTDKHREDFARTPVGALPELLATQRKSQEEWEAEKQKCVDERRAREEAQAEAEIVKHQKAADLLKKRANARRNAP